MVLLVVPLCLPPDGADAESLYQVDDLGRYREQGRDYFDATSRLTAIQKEGRLRIQQAINAVWESRTNSELSYRKMDYLQQRVWLVKSQAKVCIDLIHRQERLLAECETTAQARRLLAQSDFFQGLNVLYRMQHMLARHEDADTLQDDLLSITLLSMGETKSTIYKTRWNEKRQDLIASLRTLRNELVYLARNLDKIDIHGGGYASSQ